MTEFIVSFELYTLLQIIILVPVLFYLLKLAYWLSDITIDQLRFSRNKRLVNANKKLIWENMESANELIKVQRELRDEFEKSKVILNDW